MTTPELARRLLIAATDADPFDFFGAGSSEMLRGSSTDEHLIGHRFGER